MATRRASASPARKTAVLVGAITLALAAVLQHGVDGYGDLAFLGVVCGFGAWLVLHHGVALIAPRASDVPRWVSWTTLAGAVAGLAGSYPRVADLWMPLMFALFARIFAEIVRGARGQGIYAAGDEEKAAELTAFEAVTTPVRLPDWNRRLLARIVDTGLLALGGLAAAGAFGTFLTALVVWPVYEIPLVAAFGATAGKFLLGIRVLGVHAGTRVGVGRAAARFALLVANLPFIFIQTRISGDILWSVDPRLSVMKPTYAGTVVADRRESTRLAALPPAQRRAELEETVRRLRAIPGPVTRRVAVVAIAVFAAILVVIALFLPPSPD